MEDTLRDVEENAVIGTSVGYPLAASDVDAHDVLQFTITSGNKMSDTRRNVVYDDVFGIDASSGQIFVNNDVLDYEYLPEFHITVRVTDKAGLYDECLVWINLLDVNDVPRLQQMSRAVQENSVSGGLVGTAVRGFDQDPLDILSYSVTGGNCWGEMKNQEDGETYTSYLPTLRHQGEFSGRITVSKSSGTFLIALTPD
jgi:hypothetical protein